MNAPALSPLIASSLVALGGALGALARHWAGVAAERWTAHGPASAAAAFPWATLAINLIGSLLMGALLGWLARGNTPPAQAEAVRLLVGVGLLGGFTTFSTFSAELVTLLHRGQSVAALGYGATSLVAGMAAVIIGLIAAQSLS